MNEAAAKAVTGLQDLLRSHQPGDSLPFLPLYNELQALHAQVNYLDFKNGSGVRYLTQFAQGPVSINNLRLVYTFQGLSADGQYYVAAVLPVTHPDLPFTQEISQEQAAEMSDYPAYLAANAAWLEAQPAGSFTPSLDALDALVQSIQVH